MSTTSATSAAVQRLSRRVAQAERQVARRQVARDRLKHNQKKYENRQIRGPGVRDAGLMLKEAIVARSEGWELGPLAPRRDVWSTRTETHPHWASVGMDQASPRLKLTEARVEARCAWAGGSKTLCLREEDRVAVIEGPWKGRIGRIESFSMESASLKIKDLQVNVSLPDFITGGTTSVETVAAQVPISAVRLVYPLKDEATGATRDVVIRELRPGHVHYDRPTRRRTFARYVPGLNVKIPWPAVKPAEHEATKADTARIDVEERTFVPTLLRLPMPEVVLDELRGRYSKFRTRHTDEYIAAKAAEVEAKEAERELANTMLTPLQEFHLRRREARAAASPPELSEDMLERIGQVIAKNKKMALGAAGVEEVPSGVVPPEVWTEHQAPPESRPPPA